MNIRISLSVSYILHKFIMSNRAQKRSFGIYVIIYLPLTFPEIAGEFYWVRIHTTDIYKTRTNVFVLL